MSYETSVTKRMTYFLAYYDCPQTNNRLSIIVEPIAFYYQ
jgi:hypothetical protein